MRYVASQSLTAVALVATAGLAQSAAAGRADPLAPTVAGRPGHADLRRFHRRSSPSTGDKNETADIGSNYNTAIPFTYQANAHISEFRESAPPEPLLAARPGAASWTHGAPRATSRPTS